MAQITLSSGETANGGQPVFGSNTITGTTGGGETVIIGGGRQVFDPDFNAGGDTIILSGTPGQYQISRDGSTIVITGPNATEVRLPAPNPNLSTAQQPNIVFNGGTLNSPGDDTSFKLSSSTTGTFSLTNQTAGSTPTTITGTPTTVPGAGGGNPNPTGFTVTATSTSVTEGAGNITYTFTLSQAQTTAVTLNVSTNATGGTNIATPGQDFVPFTGQVVFAPGQTVQTITVQVIDDTVFEGATPEQVILTVQPVAGATVPSQVIATITDNEVAPTPPPPPPPPVPLTIPLTTAADTAVGGDGADRFNGIQDVNLPGKILSQEDSVSGGAGTDTIVLVNAYSGGAVANDIVDVDFLNVTSVEVLQANYRNIQLGREANEAGLVRIDTTSSDAATATQIAGGAGGVVLDLTLDGDGSGVPDFTNVVNVTTSNRFVDRILLNLASSNGSTYNTGTTFTPAGGAATIGVVDQVVFSGQAGANNVPNPIRITFTSANAGNGSSFDADGTTLALTAQSEDGNDGLTGNVARFDDEGIMFMSTQVGQLFDVRDVSGTARGSFAQVILGTNLADSTAAGGNLNGLLTGASVYVNAGAGNDVVVGTNGVDFLVGGGGDDTLDGGAGADSFIGGGGNDAIRGGLGIDSLTDASAAANAGSDLYFFANGEFDQAEAFNDNGTGAGDLDTIQLGGVFNGVNFGDYSTPVGDVLFTGKLGIEVLVTNIANGAGAEVTLAGQALASGIRQIGTAASLGGTFAAPVLLGSFSDDDIDASTFGAGLTINGVTGGAVITTNTAAGNSFADTVNLYQGFAFNGQVNLGGGNDTLYAGYAVLNGSNLALNGGLGTDEIIFGGAGVRTVFGGTYAITNPFGAGLVGFETITLRGGDTFVVNPDASQPDRPGTAVTYTFTNLTDANVGAAGSTLTINGGALRAGVITGFPGDGKLDGAVADTRADEVLTVNGQNLSITRSLSVQGGAANDSLTGGAGIDTIRGGVGNDVITGGGSADSLFGEAGNDLFVFANGDFRSDETVDGGADFDTVNITSATTVGDLGFQGKTSIEGVVTDITGVAGDMTAAGVGAEITLGTEAARAGVQVVNVGRQAGADGLLFTNDDIVGNGDDDVFAAAFTGNLTVNTGTGAVTTGSGNDTVTLFFGSATAAGNVAPANSNGPIRLGAGSDTLNANFQFFGGAGNGDFADGGTGAAGEIDTLVYGGGLIQAGAAVRGQLLAADSVNLTAGTIVNFEKLTVRGTEGAIAVAGANNDLAGYTTALTVNIDDTAVADNLRFEIDGSAFNTGVVTSFGPNNTVGDGELVGPTANTTSFSNLIVNGATLTALKSLFVTGGAGLDQIASGAGNDTLDGGNGNDAIAGGLGIDTITGGAGDDILTGDAGTFVVAGGVVTGITLTTVGTGGRDTINGGAGNDRILVSVAQFNGDQDNIDGGADLDTLVIVGQAATEVIADVGFAGTVDGTAGGPRRYNNMEQVELVGQPGGTQFNYQAGFFSEQATIRTISLGANTSNGSQVSVANYQSGGNFVNGGAANDILTGSQFMDTFTDGAGADTINAGGGDDVINMNGGQADGVDTLNGEAGNDVFNTNASFTNGTDVLNGGIGSDTLNLGVATQFAAATANNLVTIDVNANVAQFETIVLASGRTQVDAPSGGNDTAGSSTDYIVNVFDSSFAAGAANMVLAINGGALRAGVVTQLGAGNQLDGAGFGTSDENLGVNGANLAANHALNVTGGNAADDITTGAGSDQVNGGAGNDIIVTGAGRDSIIGGSGNDTIIAGAGIDTIDLGNDGFRDTVRIGVDRNGVVTANGDAARASADGVESITGFQTGTVTAGAFSTAADVIDFGAGIINSASGSITNGVVGANTVLGQAVQQQTSLLAAIQLIEQELQGGADAGVPNAGVIAFTYTDRVTGITNTYIGEITNNGANGSENFADIVQITGQTGVIGLIDVDGVGVGSTALGLQV